MKTILVSAIISSGILFSPQVIAQNKTQEHRFAVTCELQDQEGNKLDSFTDKSQLDYHQGTDFDVGTSTNDALIPLLNRVHKSYFCGLRLTERKLKTQYCLTDIEAIQRSGELYAPEFTLFFLRSDQVRDESIHSGNTELLGIEQLKSADTIVAHLHTIFRVVAQQPSLTMNRTVAISFERKNHAGLHAVQRTISCKFTEAPEKQQ